MDAFELLKQQHRQVEALFAQAHQAKGRERIATLAKLAELLTLHSALEERFLYPATRQQGLEGLADASEEAHADVKRRIAQILGAKQRDPALERMLSELENAVRRHVEEEENGLFPKLREETTLLQDGGETLLEAAHELERQDLLQLADNEGELAEAGG